MLAAMTAISHVLVLVSYAVLATGIAFSLPGTSETIGLVFGCLVFLGAALGHLAIATRQREAELAGEIRKLKNQFGHVQDELQRARIEVRELQHVVSQAGGRAGNLDAVLGEVKVLQSLVQRLWSGAAPGAGTPPASRPIALGPASPGEILDIVRDGLSAGRVDLFLQPIVGLPQRKRRFYECFSRIRDANDMVVLPEQYMPLAAKAGLMTAIDNMLLFRCIQLVRKLRVKSADLGFFCNISGASLGDGAFIQDFIHFIEGDPSLARSLIFEITEADLLALPPPVLDALDSLAELGLRFSVDNVASASMDVGALARRHVRFVKIEAARLLGFIQEDGEAARRQLRALKHQRIELIVEKVEAEKDLVELLDLNIDYGQGFLFGEPKLGPQS